MISEGKDLLILGSGAYGSYGVGKVCASGVHAMYQPLINTVMDCVVISHTTVGRSGPVSFNNSSTIDKIVKIIEVSEKAAVSSAFWAGTIVTAWSFFRPSGPLVLKKFFDLSPSEPLGLNMVEGAIGGSLIGMGAGALGSGEGSKAVRIMTGAVVGGVAGMLGSLVGALADRCFSRGKHVNSQ